MNHPEQAHTNSPIVANFNKFVDHIEAKFSFKRVKDEATGAEFKRPTVEFDKFPVPSVEGIIAILEEGGKQLDLLKEAVQDIVISRARELLNEKEDLTSENFPLHELDWEKIANLPKAERKGGGISKEVWEEFSKDYITVMQAVTGKEADKIGNAAKLLVGKFNAVKGNKQVVGFLQDQLALYLTSTPNAETYKDCVEFLDAKATLLINMDEASMLANL